MSKYFVPGMQVSDHFVDLPLDWDDPDGATIKVFYREVVATERMLDDLPLLVFLQGGPGGSGPRPIPGAGWFPEVLQHYRVILPDQRGTGRSTPIDGTVIARYPDPKDAADFLSHFLATSIVKDMEYIRQHCYGGVRWQSLGQSYGGFLTLTYLSLFPEALSACYVTGGIPGVPASAANVYAHTYPRAKDKSLKHYARYPQDVEITGKIADLLAGGDIVLPNGDPLSVERFQTLGMLLGMGPGSERLHWILDEAFVEPGRLSEVFLHRVFDATSSATDPLFWTLQEFIYGSGANGPINWAAEHERANHLEFSPSARPLLFTSEMTFSWMFSDVAQLRPFKPAVTELMQRVHWPELYNEEVLANNQVPLQSLVYFDDVYVDSGIQLDTLSRIGNAQAWVTTEFEHDGATVSGTFTKLYDRLYDRGGPLH